MEIKTLKEKILAGTITNELLIFTYVDNKFLVDQYINKIAAIKQQPINIINSLSDLTNSFSLVIDYTEKLNVLYVDEFDEYYDDYDIFSSVIIVCKKVNQKIAKVLDANIVDFPKLVNWQIVDYVKVMTGLTEQDAAWLVENTGDVYAVQSELDKLSLFPKAMHEEILAKLRFDKNSYLYKLKIFDLVDALIYNKNNIIIEFLRHKKECNENFIGVVNLLLSKVKQILLITQQSGKTATDLGISQKQFNYIKYNSAIALSRLKHLLSSLAAIDMQIKTGKLDLPDDYLFDYLIIKLQ